MRTSTNITQNARVSSAKTHNATRFDCLCRLEQRGLAPTYGTASCGTPHTSTSFANFAEGHPQSRHLRWAAAAHKTRTNTEFTKTCEGVQLSNTPCDVLRVSSSTRAARVRSYMRHCIVDYLRQLRRRTRADSAASSVGCRDTGVKWNAVRRRPLDAQTRAALPSTHNDNKQLTAPAPFSTVHKQRTTSGRLDLNNVQ